MRVASAALILLGSGAALADEPIDITPHKEKMAVLADGKGHYVALVPFTMSDGPDSGYLFYGDGKTFHAQRRTGGGRSGQESFDTVFWEPRVNARYKAQLSYRDKVYKVSATTASPSSRRSASRRPRRCWIRRAG
jgi:hypothetical protein